MIVLNPFAPSVLTQGDRALIEKSGLVVIDCSWNKADTVFASKFGGVQRRLPTLLAANPTYYAQPGRLSSAEALAATLYIVGLRGEAQEILRKFKWGPTFLLLNRDPLEAYSSAPSAAEIVRIEAEYF